MTPIEPTCERVLDASAYVLGALAEQEVEPYREHLSSCADCTAEVAQLQAVADAMALAPQRIEAPESLRAAVMGVVNGQAELLRAAGHQADRPARERARWRTFLQPALAAGVALAAGLLIGALAINSGSTERTKTIEAVVAAPGYHATASLRKVGSHVVLVVTGMPAPPPGRIYEVWLEHGTQAPEPTDALFSVTRTGAGSVGVPSSLSGISKVLVTDEPLGGSLKPTRTPIIVASV
jgi:hypothetical protein